MTTLLQNTLYVQIIVNNYTVSSVHFGIIAKNDGMEHKVHKTYLK